MEWLGYLAALGAASSWALSSMFSVGPVRTLGAIPFNAIRMAMVAVVLTLWLSASGQLLFPATRDMATLLFSGFVGIFLGDTLLFWSVKILGPRMAGLLFATNAPISFVLGLWLLEEEYNLVNTLGVVAVFVGVCLAIATRGKAGSHNWEQSFGNVTFGLATGFGAALCQSLGSLIVFDLMKSGQDPVFATMVRVWIAVLCLAISLTIPAFSGGFKAYRHLTLRLCGQILISGMLGMAIGMSLLLWAMNVAPLGIVAILSATTPVIVLPALWLFTREIPSRYSIFAAFTVVIGTTFIFVGGS